MRLLPKETNLQVLLYRPFLFVRIYRGPLLVLLAGAAADALTTYQVVRSYGAEVEVHPVQRLLFGLFSAHVAVPLAKVIQLCFVVLVASWWRRWCGGILTACGLLYVVAAMSNHFGWL
jgi:hypothetical protein